MTLAIAHEVDGCAVLDCVRERKPPFNPADVVAEFASTMKLYRVHGVSGDRYAGEWPRERFREHEISYEAANKPKSDLYRELLPLLNSRQVELLDHSRLAAQLCNLERRTARGGRDSIDHPPGGHDDLINATAGALVRAADGERGWYVVSDAADDPDELTSQKQVSIGESAPAQLRRMLPTMLGEGYGERRCATCEFFTAGTNGVGKCEQLLVNVEAKAHACELYELGMREDVAGVRETRA